MKPSEAAQEIIRAYVLWLAKLKDAEKRDQQGLPLTSDQQEMLDEIRMHHEKLKEKSA